MDVRQQPGRKEKLADELLSTIIPLGIALSAEKDFDRLLERILLEAKSICNADAGTLYLVTEDKHLKFAIVRTDSLKIALGGTTGKDIPFPLLPLYDAASNEPNHHNVATHVALEGQSVNIPDIYHAEGFDFSGTKTFDERNGYRSTSSLTVPLKNYDSETIGVLQLLNALDPETGRVVRFDSYLQQVVESLASQAAVALNNRLLMEHQRTLLKYEHDLEIGQQIQTGFLPRELPKLQGWDLAAYYHPARRVGGDFYDVFVTPGNQIAIVLGDVCDKGVGAALFMALFRSLIRALSMQPVANSAIDGQSGAIRNKRIAALLADLGTLNTIIQTNDYVFRNHGDANMFATVFFGMLDTASGVFSYVNGGHNPPVIVGAAGIKARLKPTGPAVGMFEGAQFDIGRVSLDPGDTLFLFTDGVPEIHSPTGELFTEKRMLPLVQEPAAASADLLARVRIGLEAHRAGADQFDDITMVALKRGGGSMKPLTVSFWGVRGSIPSPGPTTVRYGGNSPCVTINLGTDKTLVFDAGTGIRKLGDSLAGNDARIYIVLSHVHWDHVQGYPFFAPIYQQNREIHLIPTMPDISLFDVLFRQMDGAHFPVNADNLPSKCHYVTANGMQFLHEHGFDISRIATDHPGGCYGYRVENEGRSVIYISDNELDPPSQRTTSISEFTAFCQGADILIHDSQYVERDMPHKHGWGHSLVSQVRQLAAAARVKQLILFHHDPDRSDDELDALQEETRTWLDKNSRTECTVAHEGLQIAV